MAKLDGWRVAIGESDGGVSMTPRWDPAPAAAALERAKYTACSALSLTRRRDVSSLTCGTTHHEFLMV